MDRLRELRENKGITQTKLAMELGCHQQNISRTELGISDPPASLLIEIANYFHVSVDYLLGLTPMKESLKVKSESDFFRISPMDARHLNCYRCLSEKDKELIAYMTEQISEKNRGDSN